MMVTDPLITCDRQNLSPWICFYKKYVPRPLIQTATGEIIATSPKELNVARSFTPVPFLLRQETFLPCHLASLLQILLPLIWKGIACLNMLKSKKELKRLINITVCARTHTYTSENQPMQRITPNKINIMLNI